jgi:ABC-type multidrug transport system permease subunit
MRRIALLALNDLRLTVRDRWSFLWMLLLPLAMMWFFGQMGGGQGKGPPKFTLTVVDRDGGWVARAFVGELRTGNVELKELPPAEAEKSAKKVRTLVLPEGFTANVLAGKQQTLRLDKDEGAASEFSRAAEVHIVRAIARTLALLVEMKQTGALTAATPAEEFARLQTREPLVRLEVSTAGRGRAVPGGMAQSVPGILTMIVLMNTVIYGGVFLTIEKRGGMLRRQVSLPVSRAGLFAGKFGGRFIVAGLQTVVLVMAGRFLFRVDLGRSPAGLALLLACYIFAVAGIATFFGAVLQTPEQASAIGWIASMVMAAMGGCWWPSEVVPRWLWHAAHIFPTAWAMDAFHALISFGRGLDAVVMPALALLAFGLVFCALGARYLDPASA